MSDLINPSAAPAGDALASVGVGGDNEIPITINQQNSELNAKVGHKDMLAQAVDASDWFWTESQKGEGPVPDWVDKKYKSVSEQAKANREAQKYIGELKQRLGTFSEGPPPEYDFSSVETEDYKVNKQDPLISQFTAWARDAKLPQSVVSKMLEFDKQRSESKKIDYEQEFQKLGPNYNEQLTTFRQWMVNNLPIETQEFLKGKVQTAQDFKAVKMLKDMTQSYIPTHMATQNKRQTLEELKKEYADNLYQGKKISQNSDLQVEYMKKFKELM